MQPVWLAPISVIEMKMREPADEVIEQARQWARATVAASMAERRALHTATRAKRAKAEYKAARKAWKQAKKDARQAAKSARQAQAALQRLREQRARKLKKCACAKSAGPSR